MAAMLLLTKKFQVGKLVKVCRLILEDENGVVQGWAAI